MNILTIKFIRLVHGDNGQDLQQVVLNNVSQGSQWVIKGATSSQIILFNLRYFNSPQAVIVPYGFKEDVNNPDSTTETYAAITVYIDSPRWQGIPIRLLTGKAVNERKAEVSLSFHGRESETKETITQNNHLRFRIQPNEGIELELNTKKPGFGYEVQTTVMDFSYATGFAGQVSPNAYERVLVDAIKGDRTLFATSEEVLLSWRIVQPVIDAWYGGGSADDLMFYEPGSSGP